MEYLKRILVGKNFKIGFFKSWGISYKIEGEYLYFNDEKCISRLNLDKNNVQFVTKIWQGDINNLADKVDKLSKKCDTVEKINNEFLHVLNDFNDELYKVIKPCIAGIEKKSGEIENGLKTKTKNLEEQFEVLTEIFTDRCAKEDPFPNVLSSDFNLQAIMNGKSKNNEKFMQIILLILKKALLDKGMSLR